MSHTKKKSKQIQRWIESNPEKVTRSKSLCVYSVIEFEGELCGLEAYQHVVELSDDWVDPITQISTVMETTIKKAIWHLENLTPNR